VVRTRVGYAGGTKKNPTYHDLGDHTETVQLDYDPTVISYEKLLAVFWDSHDAASSAWSRQYMSMIFYHDDEQKRLATASRDHEAARRKSKIDTEIRPYKEFFLAEDYHQKHALRSERDIFLREFMAIYPSELDFVNSTAVARVNGFLDGYGTLAELQAELPGLGLSPQAGRRLADMVSKRPGGAGCPI
jgi:peptide-methionine (S)-S-oxide reductase